MNKDSVNGDLIRGHVLKRMIISCAILMLIASMAVSVLGTFDSLYKSSVRRMEINQKSNTAPMPGQAISLNSVKRIQDSFPSAVISYVSEKDSFLTSGIKGFPIKLVLSGSRYNDFLRLKLIKGSYFNEDACENGKKEAVISSKLAVELFGSYNVVGLDIGLNNNIYKVAGVYEKKDSLISFLGSEGMERVYVPYESTENSGSIPVKTVLIKDDELEEGSFRVQKMEEAFADSSNINLSSYKINDYYDLSLPEQLEAAFMFFAGLWCIWLGIKLFIRLIKHNYNRFRDSLDNNYLFAAISTGRYRIFGVVILCAVFFTFVVFIIRIVSFDVYIPPEYVPQNNIFDFEFYAEKIKLAVNTANSSNGYIPTAFEKDVRYTGLLCIILSACLLPAFLSFVSCLKVVRLMDNHMKLAIKGLIISLAVWFVSYVLLTQLCGFDFVFPFKEAVIFSLTALLICTVKIDVREDLLKGFIPQYSIPIKKQGGNNMKLNNTKRGILIGLVALILISCLVIVFISRDNYGDSSKQSNADAESTGANEASKVSRPEQSKVAIVQSTKAKAKDITYEDIKDMVKEAVNLAGGFDGLIKDGMKVAIKPNLVTMKDYCLPGWGGRPLEQEVNGNTTDWRVTKAIVELVRVYNPSGKVYVMEGSAQPTRMVMQHLNYTKEAIPGVDEFIAIEEDSGAFGDYNSPGLSKVSLPNGLIHNEYYLNRKYKEADVLISVPCLKNHWSAAVSGAIKNVSIGASPANVYGESPDNTGRGQMVVHDDAEGSLHKWIHDFFLCRPVDFVIMDGLQGIQNGPTPSYDMSGTDDIKKDQMNMRLIVAGRDAVAVDTIESLVMNWDPGTVGYLKYLNESKAGNSDITKITVVGKQVDEVRKDFEGRNPIAGGEKIKDKIAPKLSVTKADVKDGKLSLNLSADEDTAKVEVYIDDKLYSPVVTAEFSNITIDMKAAGKGKHTVKVNAYDRCLNRTSKTIGITNDVDNIVSDGSYAAPKAGAAPLIDGLGNDDCWANAPWGEIKYLWMFDMPEQKDFKGRYKVVWTPEKLYYLVEITDDKLSPVNPDPLSNYPEYDCLELFLDEDHSGGDHQANYNAFAYHIALDYNVVDMDTTGTPRLYNDHVKVKRTNKGNVYTWEVSVDIYNDKYDENSSANKPVALSPAKELGFAAAYCDSDSDYGREHFMGSIDIPGADKNVAWQNASVFGRLMLLE